MCYFLTDCSGYHISTPTGKRKNPYVGVSREDIVSTGQSPEQRKESNTEAVTHTDTLVAEELCPFLASEIFPS